MARYLDGALRIGGQPDRPLLIAGVPMPAAIGSAASFAPAISGGNAPYALTLVSGALPAGRSLAGLAVTGTYSAAGSFSYVLRATDAAGANATLPVDETVSAAATALPATGAMVARFSASSIPAQADNSVLTSWTDLIHGVVAAQATPAAQPKYRTNRLNGKPSVQFSGAQALVAVASGTAYDAALKSQNYTIMIVGQALSATANGMLLSASQTADNRLLLYGNGSRIGRFDGVGNALAVPSAPLGSGLFTSGVTSTTGRTGLVAGLERIWVNGGCVAASRSSAGPASSADLGLGGASNLAGGYCGAFEAFEFVIYNRELTPAEAVQFAKWACDQYGQPYFYASAPFIFVADGDSSTQGANADAEEYSYPSIAAAAMSLPYGAYFNLGVFGCSLTQMIARGGNDVDPLLGAFPGKTVKLAGLEWYNSENVGENTATNSTSYVNARVAAGWSKVCWGTSVTFSQGVNPTLYASGKRAAYNSYWAANAGLVTALARTDLNANVGVDGACPASAPYGTYWSGDGLHPSGHAGASGYREIAGVFAPLVQAM